MFRRQLPSNGFPSSASEGCVRSAQGWLAPPPDLTRFVVVNPALDGIERKRTPPGTGKALLPGGVPNPDLPVRERTYGVTTQHKLSTVTPVTVAGGGGSGREVQEPTPGMIGQQPVVRLSTRGISDARPTWRDTATGLPWPNGQSSWAKRGGDRRPPRCEGISLCVPSSSILR